MNKKTSINPIKEFPNVERMLYDLAWKFSKKFRLPFEDARSEAYAGFMKACNNFRPGKGMKFSSWCYMVTWGYLQSWIMKRARDPLTFVEIKDELLGSYCHTTNLRTLHLTEKLSRHQNLSETFLALMQESPREFLDATESLSVEASHLLELFLEVPAELGLRRRADQVSHAKRRHARQHGPEKTEASFRELTLQMQAAWA